MNPGRGGLRLPSRGVCGPRGTDRSRLRQWWLIAFVLGVSMINFPFLQIFNRPVSLGGLPLLFLYFTVGWGAAIAVIALYARILGRLPPEEEG